MSLYRNTGDRLRAIELTDSFLAAVTPDPITIGKDWVQASGFIIGTHNYDAVAGPDLKVSDDGLSIETLRAGRYFVSVNFQLASASGDGWFEGAVEPNGLSLAEWPTDLEQGHDGRYVPAAVLGWDDVEPGMQVGYTPPSLRAGATIGGWARFGSADGTETCDAHVILYATRLTT